MRGRPIATQYCLMLYISIHPKKHGEDFSQKSDITGSFIFIVLDWSGVGWGWDGGHDLNMCWTHAVQRNQSKSNQSFVGLSSRSTRIAQQSPCIFVSKCEQHPPALWPSGCNMFCPPLMTDLIPYFGPSCWFWFSLMATSCYLLMVDICQAPVHIHLRSNGCVLKM